MSHSLAQIHGMHRQAFAELLGDNPRNGIYKSKEHIGKGIKLVRMGELFTSGSIDCTQSTFELIDLTEAEKRRFLLADRDLLFSRTSVVASGVGKCSIVRNTRGEEIAFDSNMIRFRLAKDKALPEFYYYYFNSPMGRNEVLALASGAAVTTVTGTGLSTLAVPCPPMVIQRKIAAILSAYDDLILNNNRRIRILEEMARLIYREWFINFRFPGHENLSMVDSPMGAIPEGWQTATLAEMVEAQYGYTESASDQPVGPKFLRGTDINKQPYIEWDAVPYCRIHSTNHAKFRLSIGDIVVIRMADPGKVGIVEKEIDAVFASYLVRLRIISPMLSPYYLFHFLLSDRYQGYIAGASTGTTRKSASAGVLIGIDMLVPCQDVRIRFEEQIAPIRMMMSNLLDMNANLRRTRDLLLPRLISGELDVSRLHIDVTEDAA